ncbi:MAG: cobalt-precorrin 5A hydrolase [Desulfamplus sp.]|nr:cobalt-precorrin 5A hydrolase [Desulfamplus sp.]
MRKIAIWAITSGGLEIGLKLLKALPSSNFFISNTVAKLSQAQETTNVILFDKLAVMFQQHFTSYDAHICIFSTGIAVRMVAPLIKSKVSDPAVVVIDDKGFHAISLISGHIGGANELALEVGEITGATPVITTATDVNNLPSIDIVAKKQNLFIENPDMIKKVNMAFLHKKKIALIDPFNLLKPHIPHEFLCETQSQELLFNTQSQKKIFEMTSQKVLSETTSQEVLFGMTSQEVQPKVEVLCSDVVDVVSHETITSSNSESVKNTLILRPLSLFVGMGCNRGTTKSELLELLITSFNEHNLSINSVAALATTSIKQDEKGLLELSYELGKPINFYSKTELNSVKTIQNPSKMVEKHIGVKSVCEAAAILAAQKGKLIVPKIKKGNATLAVARIVV